MLAISDNSLTSQASKESQQVVPATPALSMPVGQKLQSSQARVKSGLAAHGSGTLASGFSSKGCGLADQMCCLQQTVAEDNGVAH